MVSNRCLIKCVNYQLLKNMRIRFSVTVLIALFFIGQTNVLGQARMSGMGNSSVDMSNFAGIITGQIVDSLSKESVEFANIALYRQRDSSLVTGTMTDAQGNFKLEKLAPGRFYLEVKFIGYKSRKLSGIAVSPRTPQVNLGKVGILSSSQDIEAVVVTGEKRMLQHNLDKKVINVDKDIASQGGTALDVLQNVPSVDVDNDGNVSLRGSTNVNILIDGRPSNLTSLDELPAQMIESVEVITNPSARYDPDGLSGIVNIVLKKKKERGYNGMVSLMAGTGDKYNGSLSLNVRQNKFNFFANYDFRKMRMDSYSNSNRITMLDKNTEIDSSSYLFQDQDGLRNGMFNNFRGGVDYSINSKTTLSFTGSFNVRGFDNDNSSISNSSNSYNSFISVADRKSVNDNSGIGQEYALNFKRTFDSPGQEWTADVFFSRMDGTNESEIYETINKNSAIGVVQERSNTDSWINTFTVQTDYVRPIGNGGRLEAGLKGTIRENDADYLYDTLNIPLNQWNIDPTRSNRFVYNEQVYSVYGIYSNTFADNKFSYQIGVRVEDQVTNSDQRSTKEKVDTSRLNFFPSMHLRWEPNQKNSFQVSYSRRVNRPNAFILNPFLNTSDKYNWSKGNPYLEPEFTSSVDFSYNLNYPKTKVSSSVFYRDTRNGFSRKVSVIDTVKTLSTYINLSHNESYGVEGVLTQTFTKWWRISANYSYFYTKLHGDVSRGADEGSAWTAKLTSFFTIGKNVDFQINGNYRSKVISAGGSGRGFFMMGGAQGETKEMYWIDLGARVNVLNNKGTITLRVSDIFKTQTHKSDTWDTNFTSYSESGRDSRVVFIGFSYRINNYKMRREKRNENEDIMEGME